MPAGWWCCSWCSARSCFLFPLPRGQRRERGLLMDAAAAYAFATARYSADKIVVWGFSLGSGVAVAITAEQPVGRLILEAPYTSIADVAASAFPIFPVRLVIKDP